MNKEFWIEIPENDYKLPDGHSLAELTRELFSYIGSTDPELRDDIGYAVFANWLKRELYSVDEMRGFISELLGNLDSGIGDIGSDSVFLRTFSILWLAEIVHNDNKRHFLTKAVSNLFWKKDCGILRQKGIRVYVPVKGWAHSLAHTADLMMVLGANKYLGKDDLSRILVAIAEKVAQLNNYVYIHREDERLASAVIQIIRRDLLSYNEIEKWTTTFLSPDGFSWKGSDYQEEISRAHQNTRNLLRGIYLALITDEKLSNSTQLAKPFLDILKSLKIN